MTKDEDLPRHPSLAARHSFFSAFFLVVIGLVLAAPLLQGETLCTDDGALHIYRTVALDRALRDGVLYPRWFPDLAYGYGFPFFVYREPLGYYTLEALHLLGLSVPNAFNLTLAGSLILSGIAMFYLARDIFGARGGLLAGLVYLGAPYLLIGPLIRGNLPEVIAFALMPLILFIFRRLIVFRQTRYFVAAILSCAALFLTHNISSLLFTPLLLAYAAILGWVQAADGRWLMANDKSVSGPWLSAIRYLLSAIRHLRYALLAAAVALGITSFFWLPALAEQDQAQVYLTHSTRGNDYHFNFIHLDELFAGPGAFDPNLLNPPLRISFGWAQLALAAGGILAYRRASNREQRVTCLAALIAMIALTLMALPITLPLWDNLPLIRFVQFPWRFVGRAMLPAALLAGTVYIAPQSTQGRRRESQNNSALSAVESLFFFGAALVTLLFTAPLSYPRQCPTPHDLDMTNVFAYERGTGHIGVDPLGAYLPRTVVERPAGSPLEAMYAAGQPIERFDASALPGGARIQNAQYGPNRADLSISTPTGFTATYLSFAFPGWSVRIDDRPAEIQPSDPIGLITFDVPAGDRRIRVEFGDSPQRAVADGTSLIALLAGVAAVVSHYRLGQSPVAYRLSQSTNANTQHAIRNMLLVPLVLAIFLLVKLTLIDNGLTPLRSTRLQGDALSGISHPLDITFGNQLRLLGYDVSASASRPGEIVRIDLYWKALRPLEKVYQAEVGIADVDGWPWSPKHAERPRDYNNYPATPLWPIGAYAIDSFEVEVLPGTPPGAYTIAVQVFDRDTLAPLQPGAASLPGRVAAPIGSIRVDRAARTFDAGQLRIYGGERHELDDALTLLGYNIDRVDTAPGESVLLTFFWQADRAPLTDRLLHVELSDAAGKPFDSKDVFIGGEIYPTSLWQAGEQVISLVAMRVPAATPSGEYHWRGALLDESGQPVDSFEMQPPFQVTAPQRNFRAPQMANRLEIAVGDFARLLGFDLAPDPIAPGEAVELTLYWQARAETEKSYKVFVHLLDAGGRVFAQADAIPVNNTRPTTGWLPGEVLTDRYTIALPGDSPIGQYLIVTGLYDPENNNRLKANDGSAAISLGAIDVR